MPRRGSLIRNFALLSLVTIALITTVQISVQWQLLREDLLDRERTSTAEAIRVEASAVLRADDFARWDTREAEARFTEFFRRALSNPEVLRVKLYSADMRVVWSDEPRLRGEIFSTNSNLKRALRGETVAHLDQVRQEENPYEQSFAPAVELYVPLVLHRGGTPGTAAVDGVVEIYKDPARRFANFTRDRVVIGGVSFIGALLLYAVLFWIVRRAARQMET